MEIRSLETANYRKFATKAFQFKELGLNQRTIAIELNVDDKNISKSIEWISEVNSAI